MRPIMLTIGLILVFFGIYPPFGLTLFVVGMILTLLGLFLKQKGVQQK